MKIELRKEHKKSAIVSIGTRISLESLNIRSIDLFYLREYLQNVLGRECDFVSTKLKTDNHRAYFKEIAETDLNDYDEVWIYNSALNAFGGLTQIGTIQTFDKICDFNGDIFYMLIDPKLPCKNVGRFFNLKMKSNNGKIPTDSKEMPLYDLDQSKVAKYTNEIWPRIITAFDGVDYEKYKTLNRKTTKRSDYSLLCDGDWCMLPLAEFYSVNENLDLKLKNYNFTDKKYDLIYFGNNRQTSRGQLIAALYDRPEFNVFIAGYDPEFVNAKVEISKYVYHDELFPLICSSFATVVCGDELHNDNIKTVRFFEAMLLDTVAFIHNSYDSEHKYISNKELADFIYIETADDIKERLDKIKNDEDFYHKIIEAERKEIFDQFGQYKMDIEPLEKFSDKQTEIELF